VHLILIDGGDTIRGPKFDLEGRGHATARIQHLQVAAQQDVDMQPTHIVTSYVHEIQISREGQHVYLNHLHIINTVLPTLTTIMVSSPPNAL
jgi:hypothetical protein